MGAKESPAPGRADMSLATWTGNLPISPSSVQNFRNDSGGRNKSRRSLYLCDNIVSGLMNNLQTNMNDALHISRCKLTLNTGETHGRREHTEHCIFSLAHPLNMRIMRVAYLCVQEHT